MRGLAAWPNLQNATAGAIEPPAQSFSTNEAAARSRCARPSVPVLEIEKSLPARATGMSPHSATVDQVVHSLVHEIR